MQKVSVTNPHLCYLAHPSHQTQTHSLRTPLHCAPQWVPLRSARKLFTDNINFMHASLLPGCSSSLSLLTVVTVSIYLILYFCFLYMSVSLLLPLFLCLLLFFPLTSLSFSLSHLTDSPSASSSHSSSLIFVTPSLSPPSALSLFVALSFLVPSYIPSCLPFAYPLRRSVSFFTSDHTWLLSCHSKTNYGLRIFHL